MSSVVISSQTEVSCLGWIPAARTSRRARGMGKAYIGHALAQHKGNVSHTALALNISRVELQQS
jgi:transcriptional regulator with PAS, ATPase and Fis domain